jgi:hypothetical protein
MINRLPATFYSIVCPVFAQSSQSAIWLVCDITAVH